MHRGLLLLGWNQCSYGNPQHFCHAAITWRTLDQKPWTKLQRFMTMSKEYIKTDAVINTWYRNICANEYFLVHIFTEWVPLDFIVMAKPGLTYITDTTSIETGTVSSAERCRNDVVIDWYTLLNNELYKTRGRWSVLVPEMLWYVDSHFKLLTSGDRVISV